MRSIPEESWVDLTILEKSYGDLNVQEELWISDYKERNWDYPTIQKESWIDLNKQENIKHLSGSWLYTGKHLRVPVFDKTGKNRSGSDYTGRKVQVGLTIQGESWVDVTKQEESWIGPAIQEEIRVDQAIQDLILKAESIVALTLHCVSELTGKRRE